MGGGRERRWRGGTSAACDRPGCVSTAEKRQIVRTVISITATTINIVITKLSRDTIHARSLDVLSYHLDAPMSLFFW